MALNPIVFTELVVRSFLRYQLTAYPFADARLRDSTDPETGERYTVKRYPESEKVVAEDGTWRHFKITLKPSNPDFKAIVLTCEDEGSVKVVAEMLEVVG